METRSYWIHALSPIHSGVGRGTGFVDLPIAREKVTQWPMIPGSTLKGVLADHHNASAIEQRENEILKAFGATDSNAGALVFSDARLLCFPVRSLKGTFAWVTCPLALARFRRDFPKAAALPDAPAAMNDNTVRTAKDTQLVLGDKVYLDDLDFEAKQDNANTDAWADFIARHIFPDDPNKTDDPWRKLFKERFLLLPDNHFDYLVETATEVTAHVRIEPDRKIVQGGALWWEECLPTESILYGVAWCDKVFGQNTNGITAQKLVERFLTKPLSLQLGGKATVGKGQVRCHFHDMEAAKQ